MLTIRQMSELVAQQDEAITQIDTTAAGVESQMESGYAHPFASGLFKN